MVLTLDQELLDGIRQIIREEISGVKEDISSLKDDVSTLKSDVTSLKTDVSSLMDDVSTLKSDVSSLKTDVSLLKDDVSGLKIDVAGLKSDVAGLKSDVAAMKPQLEENTQMIKTLLARTEANGAKIDQLDNKVAHLQGSEKRQNKLEDELYHHRHKIIIETGEPEFKAS